MITGVFKPVCIQREGVRGRMQIPSSSSPGDPHQEGEGEDKSPESGKDKRRVVRRSSNFETHAKQVNRLTTLASKRREMLSRVLSLPLLISSFFIHWETFPIQTLPSLEFTLDTVVVDHRSSFSHSI